MKKLLYILITIIILSVIGFFGFKAYNKMTLASAPLEINGTYFENPRMITPFSLKKANGMNFDDTSLMNNWSLVFFGYTRCPDICPRTLEMLNQFYSTLNKLPGVQKQDLPEIIFISVDTNRDDYEQLKEFTGRFNKNFLGVSGEQNQIANLAKNLGVVYKQISVGTDNDNYLFDHSSTIYAINPKGELQALFTAPHDPKIIANQFKNMIDRYKLLS